MRMLTLLLSCRYLMFVVFILCNAVICGVSVWNFFIAQAINWNLQVDAFVIVVGASALVFIFPVIFVNLVAKTLFVCRVWFECAWVGLFFCLEFAAAVGLTAIVPSLLCTNTAGIIVPGSCTSTQVLLAFTWTCAIILLGYFFLLLLSSIMVAKSDPRIWQRPVRQFTYPDNVMPGWTESGTRLVEKPVTQRRSRVSIVAPRPRRVAPAALYEFQSGIGNDGYNSPPNSPPRARKSISRPAPIAPIASSSTRQQTSQWVRDISRQQPTSFYPQHVQTTFASYSFPPYQPPARVKSPDLPPIPQPQPLGDWPRPDALSQPLRGRRQKRTVRSPPPPLRDVNATIPPTIIAPTIAPPPPAFVISPTRSRPMGPRTRSQGGDLGRSRPYHSVGALGERTRDYS
jgi:type IV secretory pathway TrbD component